MTTPGSIVRDHGARHLISFVAAAAVVGLRAAPASAPVRSPNLAEGRTPVSLAHRRGRSPMTDPPGGPASSRRRSRPPGSSHRPQRRGARWLLGAGRRVRRDSPPPSPPERSPTSCSCCCGSALSTARSIVATQIAGSALLIGSVLSGGLGGLGRMMAASELNPMPLTMLPRGLLVRPRRPRLPGSPCWLCRSCSIDGCEAQRDTEGLV